jgi:N-acetylglucosaminyldiphosphoundecaprenol N-acetyl-beta-D-mannosaminyltransferase
MTSRVWIWGIPFAPLTRAQAGEAVFGLVEVGQPSFFITANTHYAMLTKENPDLETINAQAAFVLADGAPPVWASRWKKTPLPERVAGSDLIFDLCERAERGGYRVFLLGGAEGVADEAAEALHRCFPDLQIAGTASPPFRELNTEEHAELLDRVRAARPDLLFVAFGQPKGELWIARHFQSLSIPVCVQIGASLDFVAGRVRRAPLHLQRLGLEWAYRMWLEPSRLAPRYARNALFLLSMVARDLMQTVGESFSRYRARPPLLHQPAQGNSSPRGGEDSGVWIDSSAHAS